jgi:hypothetical protein
LGLDILYRLRDEERLNANQTRRIEPLEQVLKAF